RLWFAICLDWPRAQQSLIKQILFIRVRRFEVIDRSFPTAIRHLPALQRTSPNLGNLGNCHDSRTHIFAAFCVVRRGAQQGGWPIASPIEIMLMKRLDAEAKLLRLAAYFV